jgi:adenylate cyclase
LSRAEVEDLLRGLSEAEKVDLLVRIGEVARRDEALTEVARRVSDTLSLDILFPRLMEVVIETIGADRSTLFLYDPETEELFSRVIRGGVIDEVRFPARMGIAGSVFASGKGEIIPDAYADPRFNREVDQRTGYRTRNILCAPIRNKKREVIGITQALNKRDGAFDDADLHLLEGLALQAAAALENAQMFEKVERGKREEAVLLEVVSSIASEIFLDPLLQKIVGAAAQLLEADRGTLFLFDPLANELYSRVAGGATVKEIRFPSTAGIAGECFTTAAPINIPDAYADPRFNQEVDKKTGYRTSNMLCMPLTTQHGSKVGVMQILNKRGGPFNASDEKRLLALCAQAAVSLENARLFEEVNAGRVYNENILRSMSNAVVTLDATGRIIKINQSGLRILRRTEDEVVGRLPETVFGDRNSWVLRSLERVRSRGATDVVVDGDLLLGNGDAVSINLTTVPLRDPADAPIGYMLVLEDISREKRLKNSMSRYMSKTVVDQLLDGGEATLGGTGREVSVLFSDIRGFTAISERLGPRATVGLLNDYFTRMVDVVFEHDGILDKFVGDMIMAVFGSVREHAEDADNAVVVANKMITTLRELNARRAAQWGALVQIGVGIATGEVVVGNIGSPRRLEYTVIGDRVNLAERLETANKHYGTSILMCQFTAAKLRQSITLREIDYIRVRGSMRPVAVFEALDHHTEESFPRRAEVLAAYAEGLAFYRQRDWERAAARFREAYTANPDDLPSHVFWERCQKYLAAPPPRTWDGVWTLAEY